MNSASSPSGSQKGHVNFKGYLTKEEKKAATTCFYKCGGLYSPTVISNVLRTTFSFFICPEEVEQILRRPEVRHEFKDGGYDVEKGEGWMRMSQWYTLLGYLKYMYNVEGGRHDVEDAFVALGGSEDQQTIDREVIVTAGHGIGLDLSAHLQRILPPEEDDLDASQSLSQAQEATRGVLPFDVFAHDLVRWNPFRRESETSSVNTSTVSTTSTRSSTLLVRPLAVPDLQAQNDLFSSFASMRMKSVFLEHSRIASTMAKKMSSSSIQPNSHRLSDLRSPHSIVSTKSKVFSPREALQIETTTVTSNTENNVQDEILEMMQGFESSTRFPRSPTFKSKRRFVKMRDVAVQTKYTMKDYEAFVQMRERRRKGVEFVSSGCATDSALSDVVGSEVALFDNENNLPPMPSKRAKQLPHERILKPLTFSSIYSAHAVGSRKYATKEKR